MNRILLILLISFLIFFMILKYNKIDLRSEHFIDENSDNLDTNDKLEVIDDESSIPPIGVKLSAKSGNKYIKLFWMPPNKGFETLKNYIVVLKNNKNNTTKMYYPDEINCQMCTFTINNLLNNIEYTVYVITPNEHGVGKSSNKINITPYSGKVPPKPEKKTTNITCLKSGNFKEDKYCRVQEVIEPNIDLIEYKDVLEKLKNSQNKYNFDLKL